VRFSSTLFALLLLGVLASPSIAQPKASALGYHIVDRIPLTDGWWDYASFDAEHRRLYVSRGNGVFRLDLNSGLMDNRFVPGSEGRAVIAIPGSDLALTTMAGYSSAIIFSGEDGKVSKMIDLRQASDSAVWEPIGKRVWVMGGHGEASLIDPVSLAVTDRVELTEDEPLEFSATDGKGRIFVNAPEAGSVIAVDAGSKTVIGRWKMKDCEDPTGMAYAADSDVVLSVCGNGFLKVLDAKTGAELHSVPVGKGADSVIYDAVRQRAFIPSAFDGLLTVVAVKGRNDVRVLEQVRAQIGTRTGAVDPKTGTVYLPAARFGPLNKLGWPEALPGTVEMLVLEPQH